MESVAGNNKQDQNSTLSFCIIFFSLLFCTLVSVFLYFIVIVLALLICLHGCELCSWCGEDVGASAVIGSGLWQATP